MNWLLLHFAFYSVLLSWRAVHGHRWPTASASAIIISLSALFWSQQTSRFQMISEFHWQLKAVGQLI